MKTRITELLSIQYPILSAGMSVAATPELAAAVSNAGGLGLINLTTLSSDDARQVLERMRSLTDKPFGVNMTQILPTAEDNIRLAIEAKVPVINTAFGKCDWYKDDVHRYGGKVISTVNNVEHALAAQKQGADAIMLTGYEAAAHSGRVGNIALIPAVRDVVDIPIISAGGIADGRGLVAALALGADAVSMGSRFFVSHEAGAHPASKQAVIDHGVMDTMLSAHYDGFPVRVIDTPLARKLAAHQPCLLTLLIASQRFARRVKAPMATLLKGFPGNIRLLLRLAHLGYGMEYLTKGMEQGDLKNGLQTIGQSMGLVTELKSASDIVADIICEAEQVSSDLVAKVAG